MTKMNMKNKTRKKTTMKRRQRGGQAENASSWFSGLTSGISNYFSKDQTQEQQQEQQDQQEQEQLQQALNMNNLPPVTMPLRAATVNGGKKRKHRKRMRGGFSANRSLYAADASPYSGQQTARPQVWVGGKSTKKRRKSKRR